jgi:hypothetical protein
MLGDYALSPGRNAGRPVLLSDGNLQPDFTAPKMAARGSYDRHR